MQDPHRVLTITGEKTINDVLLTLFLLRMLKLLHHGTAAYLYRELTLHSGILRFGIKDIKRLEH